MELKKRIENDYKAALKKKDKIAISTCRMLKAAIHNKEIEKRGQELSDQDIIKVVTKQLKQHQDSIEQFTKGKRQDLVEKETQELKILKQYLPKQLSEQELIDVVKRVISESGFKDKKDFGKIMKLIMAELKGKAGGELVSKIVSSQLDPSDKEK